MSERSQTSRLGLFIRDLSNLLDRTADERVILSEGKGLLEDLITNDDWLPDEFAKPHPKFYSQYLLYCDPADRFSIVSLVWGPGQLTPIHDHTVWGLIGMLRGAEVSTRFELGVPMKSVGVDRLEPGAVDMVSPSVGDIHQVANAFDDKASISIHVYGSNIGTVERHVFDKASGEQKSFVSGYSNSTLPNPWSGVNIG